MLKIQPQLVANVRQSAGRLALFPFLQNAIELEHATIPPYLTALYSLKPGLNDEIAALLRSVVIEEMLHMTIAANILVSLGGHPKINHPAFVPDYPGGLPMGIGGSDFEVHIAPFSMALVKDTFMVIEEPEQPVVITLPDDTESSDDTSPFRTIGEFYEAIQDRLRQLPPEDFGHVDRQVVGVFGAELNFPIVDAASACAAIDIIIRQGEGTSTDPFEYDQPAHYYRFGEIYYGSRLVQTTNGQGLPSFAYDGAPIAFVADGVFPMRADPTSQQFPEGSYGRTLSDAFTDGYSSLLNALHASFNGEPARIQAVMGLMYQLRFLAQRLMSTPLQAGMVATGGPVFKYRK